MVSLPTCPPVFSAMRATCSASCAVSACALTLAWPAGHHCGHPHHHARRWLLCEGHPHLDPLAQVPVSACPECGGPLFSPPPCPTPTWPAPPAHCACSPAQPCQPCPLTDHLQDAQRALMFLLLAPFLLAGPSFTTATSCCSRLSLGTGPTAARTSTQSSQTRHRWVLDSSQCSQGQFVPRAWDLTQDL